MTASSARAASLRIAVLVEVEAVEAEPSRGPADRRGSAPPPRIGRVDEPQEIAETVRRPDGVSSAAYDQRPFVVADTVDGGVSERVARRPVHRLDQSADARQRDRLLERVVVVLAAAEQVGMPVRPVVELHVG